MVGAKYMAESINPERIMAVVILAVVITGSIIGMAIVRFIRSIHQ